MNSYLYYNPDMSPGKTIREAISEVFEKMKAEGLVNQKMLADRKGCSEGTISNYLGGDRRMHEDTILFFCSALGLRWQDLDVDTGVKRDDRINCIIMKLQANPCLIDIISITIDVHLEAAARAGEERAKGKK